MGGQYVGIPRLLLIIDDVQDSFSALCLGAYGPGETPVPIPNTAVKLGRVDGSMAYAMQE